MYVCECGNHACWWRHKYGMAMTVAMTVAMAAMAWYNICLLHDSTWLEHDSLISLCFIICLSFCHLWPLLLLILLLLLLLLFIFKYYVIICHCIFLFFFSVFAMRSLLLAKFPWKKIQNLKQKSKKNSSKLLTHLQTSKQTWCYSRGRCCCCCWFISFLL